MLTETAFYDRLAAAYDLMNDLDARLAAEMPFIQNLLEEIHALDVFDCACGTGRHAIALAELGLHVAGADASPEMVSRARENARRANVAIDFTEARLSQVAFGRASSFDAVLCLGNSFPHITSAAEARASAAALHTCLRTGGLLIMQNLNYDKRWKEKPRWFGASHGTVDGKETLIWRFADYGEEFITFNIAIFVREPDGKWPVSVQSTLQRPYQQHDLQFLLVEADFHQPAWYGDLNGSLFNPAISSDLVIVARA